MKMIKVKKIKSKNKKLSDYWGIQILGEWITNSFYKRKQAAEYAKEIEKRLVFDGNQP